MNKRNSLPPSFRVLTVLGLGSYLLLTAWSVTMALTAKDRQIAALAQQKQHVERQNREFLSSILSCANGDGFTLELGNDTNTKVKCNIEHEWVGGRFYERDLARAPKKQTILWAKKKP